MATTRLSCSIALALGTLLIVAVPIAARAQATGSIAGVITDQSGAVMPGVTVDATNTATGLVRTAVTGARRLLHDAAPAAGTLRRQGDARGFKPVVQKRQYVSVGDTARVDVKLAVGGVEESVTVSGETPLVETSHATLGITIDQQKVVELPLNGRNFTQLGHAHSGRGRAARRARRRRPATPRPAGFGAAPAGFNVNGMRNQSNNFLLDGASNNDTFNTGFVMRPPPDAIQEFKIHDALLQRRVRPQRRLGRQRGHQVRNQRAARRRLGVQSRRRAPGAQFLRATRSQSRS